MKQIKTTQTVFDYLLMEIIKNRRKEIGGEYGKVSERGG